MSDKEFSYYKSSANQEKSFPTLTQTLNVDVCIIGAGFTGLNAAIELAQKGYSVAVLEAQTVGWGASGRNGGQLIRGIGHDVEGFRSIIGSQGVNLLNKMGLESVSIVQKRIEKFSINCDLTWGYCDLARTLSDLQSLEKEQKQLESLDYQTQLITKDKLHSVVGSNCYYGGLVDFNSGHLHPLNLALGEASAAQSLGVHIFENSSAIQVTSGQTINTKTKQGLIKSKYIIYSCNAYLNQLQPFLSKKILPAGSYIIATEPLSADMAKQLIPQNMALCDMRIAVDYYRLSADNRLLFGGACHYSGRDPKDIQKYMRPKMLKVFPQLEETHIDFNWSGMIGIGANRLPQLGQIPKTRNMFYAQAYSGHGLNTSHLAAKILGEVIDQKESQGFNLLSNIPHMTFPGGKYLRSPLLALGMLWHQIKERCH